LIINQFPANDSPTWWGHHRESNIETGQTSIDSRTSLIDAAQAATSLAGSSVCLDCGQGATIAEKLTKTNRERILRLTYRIVCIAFTVRGELENSRPKI
jgi:hypothetical protein